MNTVYHDAPRMLRIIKRLKQHNLYALGTIIQPNDLSECEASGEKCETPTTENLGLIPEDWQMRDFNYINVTPSMTPSIRSVHGCPDCYDTNFRTPDMASSFDATF